MGNSYIITVSFTATRDHLHYIRTNYGSKSQWWYLHREADLSLSQALSSCSSVKCDSLAGEGGAMILVWGGGGSSLQYTIIFRLLTPTRQYTCTVGTMTHPLCYQILVAPTKIITKWLFFEIHQTVLACHKITHFTIHSNLQRAIIHSGSRGGLCSYHYTTGTSNLWSTTGW